LQRWALPPLSGFIDIFALPIASLAGTDLTDLSPHDMTEHSSSDACLTACLSAIEIWKEWLDK
jgi:hypothetical protein